MAKKEKRCNQCGRIGVRGYDDIYVRWEGELIDTITVCANRYACGRRYRKQAPLRDEE